MGDFFGKRVPLGPHLGQADDIHLGNAQLLQHRNGNAELAFPAVHHEQVRQVVFRQGALITTGEDFIHHAEIVRAFHGFDPKPAVAVLIRLALVKDHHGTDREIALSIRDIETLNPFGRVLQVQRTAQVLQGFLLMLFSPPLFDKAVTRIFPGHFHQPQFGSALRTEQADLLPFAFREEFGPDVGIVESDRDKNLVGDKPATLVELAQEFSHDLRVGELIVGKAIGQVANQFPATHKQDLSFDQPAFAIQAEHVPVVPQGSGDLLLFRGFCHGPDLIPQPGGFFKTQRVRGLVHLPGEAVYQLGAFAFEQ